MASKFQNRLVGTLVLVALGIIVLPVLFDGDKKHNESQFASIPLALKPGDEEDIDLIAPLTQDMPSTPPEGAAEAMAKQAQELQPDMLSSSLLSEPAPMAPPPVEITQAPKATVKSEPNPQPKVDVKRETRAETKPEVKSESKTTPVKAPQGVAYVVQLGALKNAGKVDEIVAKLRLSGHQVYVIPSSPVQGELTRIYVGPNASRQTLESTLPELKELTGLQGQIKNYSP
ncbi:Protein dedD [Xenorhabdus bovienii str. Jollieti]|uniref:Cell division protein DedD n=1 Tax=Xenorhabdus bovienii (strain SS-2004) TaxID=406818 RepID=D3V8C3_XENBS|nr:cell division protein DedD [Xenorhabdus bovienii]CBJ82085.1 Protein dedD [Xenorhabdus bovienii SS-2004]CDH27910.1 Protein dedD [Xenorhabdus bovienii str. Jollieti]